MQLTDILSQYLYEEQYAELKSDQEFQSTKAARDRAVEELTASLSPEQTRLFNDCMERSNYLTVLELHHFFSRCSLLLLPQK